MEALAFFASLLLYILSVPSVRGDSGHVNLSHSQIYDRNTNAFSAADFYKPSGTNEEDLWFKLAPLILQQVRTNEPGRAANDVIASDFRNGANGVCPAVYFQADVVQIREKTHARLTYVWFYHDRAGPADQSRLKAQGVRITLNSAGRPAIWEILNEPGGTRLVFVAQSVEAAAQAEFGKPLPGRRYAIERSLEQAPNSIVPRIIADGPMPMGPILYLEAGTRSVSTLICRCMPAQAKSLLATRGYELRPLDTLDPDLLRTGLAGRGEVISTFFNQETGKKVEERLRLPSNF